MDEVSVLIAKSQEGDKQAREVLIENNLGLVHHIVRRFSGRGIDREDLFQIGVIGLMKSIDKFDLTMDVKFSTYAVPLITGEIKRFLRDDGIVKVSRTIKENGWKVRQARQRLQNTLGREPLMQEIVNECGLSQEDIVLAMEADTTVESIYSATYQDDGSEMYLVDKVVQGENGVGGSVGGMYNDICDTEKEKVLDKMLLEQLLEGLTTKERELIQMRYFQNKTQMEVARSIGISQVQVSRLEKKILRQMRETAKI